MTWQSSACAVIGLALSLAASPASAQTYGFLRFGNTASGDDPFCEDPTAAITMIGAGLSTPLFGVSAEYNNGDWPWPPPNDNTGIFLTHGHSFQIMAEFNPLQLVARSVSEYARPFIAVGLHHSTDGASRPDAGLGEAWGVRGQTTPIIAAGANGILPIGSRFGVTAGYRYTNLLFGDFELETPGGAIETVEGESLGASSWSVGFTVRLGN